jgi:hypothetical protein
MKYAKIKNNSLEYAPRNKGNVSNWINDEKAVLADGYLPVELQDIPEGKYQVGYEVVDGVIVRKLEDAPKPTQESSSQARISGLESYLSATDWYAIRESETGIDIPAEVKQARANAREEISRLREEAKASNPYPV